MLFIQIHLSLLFLCYLFLLQYTFQFEFSLSGHTHHLPAKHPPLFFEPLSPFLFKIYAIWSKSSRSFIGKNGPANICLTNICFSSSTWITSPPLCSPKPLTPFLFSSRRHVNLNCPSCLWPHIVMESLYVDTSLNLIIFSC